MIEDTYNQTIYKIIPIVVNKKTIQIKTFALIDCGSAITTIQPQLAKQLLLEGDTCPITIEWTDRTRRTFPDSKKVTTMIKGTSPQNQYLRVTARTMPMSLPNQTVTKEMLNKQGIENPHIETYEEAVPQILIGLDNVEVFTGQQIKLYNKLLTTKTPLGWTIKGIIGNNQDLVSSLYSTKLVELHNIVGKFIGDREYRNISDENNYGVRGGDLCT